MENYSSEIGKKMRSAVKAKLLELGSSGQNFIDDELPDYVMIMVANKRSKTQMVTDLHLFLGSKTEQFVTWLHEVLQKLQEVTLPKASVKKRKASHKEKSPVSTSRDKKLAKKDKANSQKVDSPKKGADNTTATAAAIIPASITDVVAEEVLIQAKKNLDIAADAESHIKKSKQKSSKNAALSRSVSPVAKKSKGTNGSDAPSSAANEMSSASATTTSVVPDTNNVANSKSTNVVVTGNREKDLEELAKLQRKIKLAKKKLRETGQLNEADSEEDGDLLKIRSGASSDEMDFADEAATAEKKKETEKPVTVKPRSPIVFEKTDKQDESKSQSKKEESTSEANSYHQSRLSREPERRQPDKIRIQPEEAEENRSDRHENEQNTKHGTETVRRPVRERLGIRSHVSPEPPTVPERRPRREKELYVPAHRRRENEKRDESRGRTRRDDSRSRYYKDRVPSRNRSNERNSRRTSRSRRSVSRTSRSRERSSKKEKEDENTERRSHTSSVRVNSRVIVAPARPAEPSDDEKPIDKPVNSVIKIKPRPHVSPSRQACKKLLLRAVADAQKSTLIKHKEGKSKRVPMSSRLGEIVDDNDESDQVPDDIELDAYNEDEPENIEEAHRIRMSYKEQIEKHIRSSGRSNDRLSKRVESKALFKRKSENFIVEIEGNVTEKKRYRQTYEQEESEEETVENETESNDAYISRAINDNYEGNNSNDEDYEESADNRYKDEGEIVTEKTQFVVTLNDERTPNKYRKSGDSQSRSNNSHSNSPTQRSSSQSNRKANAHMSRSRIREPARRGDLRSRLSTRYKQENSESPNASKAASNSISNRFRESTRDSTRSSSASNGTPPDSASRRRSEQRKSQSLYMDMYRNKAKDVKKLIIKNDTDEDEDSSPQKRNDTDTVHATQSDRSTTPPLSLLKNSKNPEVRGSRSRDKRESRDSRSPKPERVSRHIPITFNVETKENKSDNLTTRRKPSPRDASRRSRTPRMRSPRMRSRSPRMRSRSPRDRNIHRSTSRHSPNEVGQRWHRSRSRDRSPSERRDKSAERIDSRSIEERRRVRLSEAKKYDNIPDLNSVALDSNSLRNMKPKERCKYHPNCTKQFCEFYHPSAPCKSFPNCRYADKCLYSHPKCKFDLSCTNADCNFSHSGPRNPSQLVLSAPPLSSSVVPVQNYKSISTTNLTTPGGLTMCKYFPNCTKPGCTFFHPKPCRFGKNCINKLECNFYHADMQSSNKFKWIAAAT